MPTKLVCPKTAVISGLSPTNQKGQDQSWSGPCFLSLLIGSNVLYSIYVLLIFKKELGNSADTMCLNS